MGPSSDGFGISTNQAVTHVRPTSQGVQASADDGGKAGPWPLGVMGSPRLSRDAAPFACAAFAAVLAILHSSPLGGGLLCAPHGASYETALVAPATLALVLERNWRSVPAVSFLIGAVGSWPILAGFIAVTTLPAATYRVLKVRSA